MDMKPDFSDFKEAFIRESIQHKQREYERQKAMLDFLNSHPITGIKEVVEKKKIGPMPQHEVQAPVEQDFHLPLTEADQRWLKALGVRA